MKFDYPTPRRDETVKETKFGVEISDPYRWMEDPDSPETKEFVDAENNLTEPFLQKSPARSKLKERLTQLWNYPKYSCPSRQGDRYFFYKNTGLQNQRKFRVNLTGNIPSLILENIPSLVTSKDAANGVIPKAKYSFGLKTIDLPKGTFLEVQKAVILNTCRIIRKFLDLSEHPITTNVLYVQDSLDATPRVFLDPNVLSADGKVAISRTKFSEDGKTFAYGLSKSGSDWITIHFKDVETGEDYPDVLERVKLSSITWTGDNKGVFYGRYPQQEGKMDGSETTSNQNQKLYYHYLNTPQSEDILCVEFLDEPQFLIDAEVSDCGRWLIVTAHKDCQDNLMYYSDLLTVPDGKITGKLELFPIVEKLERDYEYITDFDDHLIVRTNKNAPNYHLVKIDLKDPSPENWTVLVKEDEKDCLDWATAAAGDKLVLCYLQDVKSVLKVFSLITGEFIQQLPLDMGTVAQYSGKKKFSSIFYQFTSFLTPGVIYRCDLSQTPFKPEVFREIEVKNFDATQYKIDQKFYTSKDGTKVPMFLVHKKDIQLNGANPCYLYAYGGFNISIQPSFSVSRIVFIKNFNGIVAVANIRGGGEYGEKWHDSGRLLNKQNTFDDLIAGAEFLINEGYTSTPRLTIHGASNGGLIMAACITQRPDLFGAAIVQAGVLDMLRFHKFTIGYAWTSDFGNPDEEKFFHNALKFSPLHNVKLPPKNVQYPATLLLTADHDDRVVPLHSLKFIATLQHVLRDHPTQVNPLLIRIETKAGHGAGKPTSTAIEELTDIFTFISESLDLPVQD